MCSHRGRDGGTFVGFAPYNGGRAHLPPFCCPVLPGISGVNPGTMLGNTVPNGGTGRKGKAASGRVGSAKCNCGPMGPLSAEGRQLVLVSVGTAPRPPLAPLP